MSRMVMVTDIIFPMPTARVGKCHRWAFHKAKRAFLRYHSNGRTPKALYSFQTPTLVGLCDAEGLIATYTVKKDGKVRFQGHAETYQ